MKRFSKPAIALIIFLITVMLVCVAVATWVIAAPTVTYKPISKILVHFPEFELNYGDFYSYTPTEAAPDPPAPEARASTWRMLQDHLFAQIQKTETIVNEDGSETQQTYISALDETGSPVKLIKGTDYTTNYTYSMVTGAHNGYFYYPYNSTNVNLTSGLVTGDNNNFAGSVYEVWINLALNATNSKYQIDPAYATPTANQLKTKLTYRTVQVNTTGVIDYGSSDWYTIEEALNEAEGTNNTIVTVGCNSSGYARTSFSALPLEYTGYDKLEHLTIDKNGKWNYNVTSKLRVPFANVNLDYHGAGGKAGDGDDDDANGEGRGADRGYTEAIHIDSASRVFSTLIIPKNVKLNVSGTLAVGGLFTNSSTVYNHGVIMNDGVIEVTSNAASATETPMANGTVSGSGVVTAMGYIKDGANKAVKGEIIFNDKTKGIEVFKPIDWKGGTNTMNMRSSKVFPLSAYSVHNISCKSTFKYGSYLEAFWTFKFTTKKSFGIATVSYVGWQRGDQNGNLKLICPYDSKNTKSNTLFEMHSDDSYVVKTADNAPGSAVLDTVAGSNQTTGQMDNLELHGEITDNTVSVKIEVDLGGIVGKQDYSMETGTDMSLPIGFMNIKLAGGDVPAKLSLSKSSYKFMPGSSLTIDKDAELTVAKGATLAFYTVDDYNNTESAGMPSYSYTAKYCKNLVDPVFMINGTATINGALAGRALTNGSTGKLIVNGNAYGTIRYIDSIANGTASTFRIDSDGNILTYNNITTMQNLSSGKTYFASDGGWKVADQPIKITVVYNDKFWTVSGSSNGTQLTQENIDSFKYADGYELTGLYYGEGEDRLQVSLEDTFYADATLYAEFEYTKGYIVNYYTDYPGNGNINQWSQTIDFGEEDSFAVDGKVITEFDNNPEMEYYFEGWYLDSDCTIPYESFGQLFANGNVASLYANWKEKVALKVYRDSSATGDPLNNLNISISWGSNGANYWLNGQNLSGTTSAQPRIGWFIPGTAVTIQVNATAKNGKTGGYSGQWLKVDKVGKDDAAVSNPYSLTLEEGSSHVVTFGGTYTKGDSSGCFAEGTLITLADGSQKKVEDLVMGVDQILVFDHMTGQLTSTNAFFVLHRDVQYSETVKLYFSNGTMVHVFFGHGFFDIDTNQYEIISPDNVTEYIGHEFYSNEYVNGEFKESIFKLVSYEISYEYSECYSIYAGLYVNHFVNGMLAVSDSLEGLYNVFELDENMKYNQEKMQADIEKYGLFTYEEWSDYCTEEEFYLCNVQYLKVALGKGLVTMEQIYHYFEDFLSLFH